MGNNGNSFTPKYNFTSTVGDMWATDMVMEYVARSMCQMAKVLGKILGLKYTDMILCIFSSHSLISILKAFQSQSTKL